MTDEKIINYSILGKHWIEAARLIRAIEAEKVVVPPDVLAQGSEAQAPAEGAPQETNPEAQSAGKGKSGSSPSPRKQNRQAPSASE